MSVSKYGTSSGSGLTFEVRELFDDRVDRLLCLAMRPDVNGLIVIKFTRRNSIGLHKFCSAQVVGGLLRR
jgi:hypothetical protein